MKKEERKPFFLILHSPLAPGLRPGAELALRLCRFEMLKQQMKKAAQPPVPFRTRAQPWREQRTIAQ